MHLNLFSSFPVRSTANKIATILLLGFGVSAFAQTDDYITVGAGVAVTPRYQGSSDYTAKGLPIIDARIGPFYARTDDGVGINLIQAEHLTLSAGANVMWGRSSNDMPSGIHGLSDELGIRLGASTNIAGLLFGLSGTQSVTDNDRGMLLDMRVSYPLAVSPQLSFIPSVATSWANEKYMNSHFEITRSASKHSGMSRYQAASGFKDISARIAFTYSITERLNINGSVGVARLVGEAADSPLVDEKSQLRTVIGASYSF